MTKFYLSSMESYILNKVRECSLIKKIKFDTGKDAFIVNIDSTIQIEYDGQFFCFDKVVISLRHADVQLESFQESPVFVYVSVLINEKDIDNFSIITKDDLYIIGIGEIYPSRKNAENHIF